MARTPVQPTEATTAVAAAFARGVVPASQHVQRPKPPGNDFAAQPTPPQPGVGVQRIAELSGAAARLTEPIKALGETLPDCSRSLLAARDALGRALVQQSAAAAEYTTALANDAGKLRQFALKQAQRVQRINPPLGLGSPGDASEALESQAREIERDVLADWPPKYEKLKGKLAAGIATNVVSALQTARKAVKAAKLRASLDAAKPDAELVESIKRTVEAEPTLLQPGKAFELLQTAIEVDDQSLILALESLIPLLQQVVETGLPKLTRSVSNPATGAPSDALQTAVQTVTALRSLRSQRLAKTSAGRAEKLLDALEFLFGKSVGIDLSDPAVVSALPSSPAREAERNRAHLRIDEGKTGCRWVTKFIRSTAPIRWPAILAPVPMTNLERNPPPGNRTPANKGNPSPLKPVRAPMRVGQAKE